MPQHGRASARLSSLESMPSLEILVSLVLNGFEVFVSTEPQAFLNVMLWGLGFFALPCPEFDSSRNGVKYFDHTKHPPGIFVNTKIRKFAEGVGGRIFRKELDGKNIVE